MKENSSILCYYIKFNEDSVYHAENLEKAKVFTLLESFYII